MPGALPCLGQVGEAGLGGEGEAGLEVVHLRLLGPMVPTGLGAGLGAVEGPGLLGAALAADLRAGWGAACCCAACALRTLACTQYNPRCPSGTPQERHNPNPAAHVQQSTAFTACSMYARGARLERVRTLCSTTRLVPIHLYHVP